MLLHQGLGNYFSEMKMPGRKRCVNKRRAFLALTNVESLIILKIQYSMVEFGIIRNAFRYRLRPFQDFRSRVSLKIEF